MGKDIVPWVCHICSGEFEETGGGICARCNKPACFDHLRYDDEIDDSGKEKRLVNVCVSCSRQEKPDELQKKFSVKRLLGRWF